MSNTAEQGIHVFVFCCADYEPLLDDCINSIDQYVEDNIIDKTIVSNIDIDRPGWQLIKDNDFWKLLNPSQEHNVIINNHWVKQQVFKLNLDKVVSGKVLIVDAEVRFHQPIKWIDNKIKQFYHKPKSVDSSEFVRLFNLEPIEDTDFIVEATIFDTKILQELNVTLDKVKELVFGNEDSPKLFMSEYDLYANYILAKGYTLELVEHGKVFTSVDNKVHSYSDKSKTTWITFYQQIKDPSWPNCNSEEDFKNLPKDIQQECIEKFGYQP